MSSLLPHSPPPARRRRGLWILLGLVVIAMVVVVTGFFFARRQIGEFSARKLGERLSEEGVFISWKSADWVPGVGVQLRGLAVYRDAARRDRLALIDPVTARRAGWLRWDKMNFKATDTQLLLGTGAAETRLDHLAVQLLIQTGNTDLREFHARLQGLRIELKCALVDAAPAGNAEAIAASKRVVQREGLFRNVNLDRLKSVKEWLKFQPEKDEPVLRMDLHSLPDDRGLSLTMTFDGSRFQWRGQKWDFVQAAVKIPVGKENAPIDIDHICIGYGGRKAELTGTFDSASRVIRISKFDSGIDVLALARAMIPDAVGSLSTASTSGAWGISGAGEIPVDQPENFRWNGHVALDGELVYASGQTNIALQKPTFSMRVEEQVVTISDLKAGLWDGSLDVARLQVPLPSKEKKLRIETQLTLNARSQSIINSFSEARKQPGVVPLNWTGAWRISGAGEIAMDQPENFRWKGDAALGGELVYASGQTNIALQKPTFSVRVEEQAVTISDLKAGLWDGSLDVARLQVHLPSKEKKLRIETQLTLNGARSSSVRKSFSAGQKQPRVVRLNWNGAWRGSAAGEIPVDHPENFRWHGEMALGGDLFYASGETKVALHKPTFSVREEKQVISISAFKAGLWEGSLIAPR